jgi:hypothetical protein
MAATFRLHLSATRALWLAMRGRLALPVISSRLPPPPCPVPGSPTKQQAPPNQVQLAAAALLFMPALLTLPTTAWFYAAACLLHLAAAAPAAALARAGGRLRRRLDARAGGADPRAGASGFDVVLQTMLRLAQGRLVAMPDLSPPAALARIVRRRSAPHKAV